MENTGIKKAKELLKAISQDEEEIRKAEMREKFIRDQHAIMLAGIEQIENPTIKDILTRKYILDESFEKIAVEKRYTYRRITQLHGDAIMMLSDKTFPTISLKNVV